MADAFLDMPEARRPQDKTEVPTNQSASSATPTPQIETEGTRQPHQVSGIPKAVRRRPLGDIERLLDYIDGPFLERWQAVRNMNLSVKQLRTQENINNLLIDANDFRMELDMWIPMAERLYDETFATAQGIVAAAAAERQASGKGRSSVQENKDKAKAEVAPLKEAVAQLRATRDSMVGLTFAAQTQLKELTTDEGLENIVEGAGVPEARFTAPVGESLRRYVRNE